MLRATLRKQYPKNVSIISQTLPRPTRQHVPSQSTWKIQFSATLGLYSILCSYSHLFLGFLQLCLLLLHSYNKHLSHVFFFLLHLRHVLLFLLLVRFLQTAHRTEARVCVLMNCQATDVIIMTSIAAPVYSTEDKTRSQKTVASTRAPSHDDAAVGVEPNPAVRIWTAADCTQNRTTCLLLMHYQVADVIMTA